MRRASDAARIGSRSTLTALQIGMTATTQRRGGVDRYFFSLIPELERWGVATRGVVLGDAGELAAESCAGVACCADDRLSLLGRWSALRKAVARQTAMSDLVAAHFAPYVFPVLDRLRGRPLVVHFHGPWAMESASNGARGLSVAVKRLLERIVYRSGARFIVLSQAFVEILEREYGVAATRVRVVPGGVDVRRFVPSDRAAARRTLGWNGARPTVVTVSRLIASKGIEQLIDAAPAIRARVPDLAIVVVGTGPAEADLRRRVRERGLEGTVRFMGHLVDPELPLAYQAADVLCVPSVAFEGFGLIVLEALACGTPAVVTPVGGLPEVVGPLAPGLVLSGSDARAIANGLVDALTGTVSVPGPEQCRSYAEQFAWPEIARRVGAVYREVA